MCAQHIGGGGGGGGVQCDVLMVSPDVLNIPRRTEHTLCRVIKLDCNDLYQSTEVELSSTVFTSVVFCCIISYPTIITQSFTNISEQFLSMRV